MATSDTSLTGALVQAGVPQASARQVASRITIVSGGLPAGGRVGEALVKKSDDAGDVDWGPVAVVDATTGNTGKVRLAGALGGTADSPTALGYANAAALAAVLTPLGQQAADAVSAASGAQQAASEALSIADDTAALLDTKADRGRMPRTADVTTGRTFTAGDFGVGVVPLNSLSVQNFTLLSAAATGLTGAGNVLTVQILGALHTITATGGAQIQSVAGFQMAVGGTYTLTQRAASDVWDLAGTVSGGTGGGGSGGTTAIDGGTPTSNYGGTTAINGGTP